MDEITVEGHAQWLALDLEADADELIAAIVAEYEAITPNGNVEAIAEVLASIAQRTAQDNPTGDDAFVLGLWAYLETGLQLDPAGTATLRAIRATPDTTARQVIDELLVGTEPYGTGESMEIDTASGPALAARVRYVDPGDADREVRETSLVVWVRPEAELPMSFLLACSSIDLVEAAPVWPALRELAAGVAGL